jgi:hypothetical protein
VTFSRREFLSTAARTSPAAWLAIDGAELRRLGIPAGPLMGEILRDLLERVTDDPALNDSDTLRGLVRERIS